jgi:hypothetical protein
VTAAPAASRSDPRRLRNCIHCLAWGVLWRPRCSSCFDFSRRNAVGRCRTCRRDLPVRDGVCRACRKQATFIAKWEGHGYEDVDLTVAARTGHQLFFAGMEGFRGSTPTQHLPRGASGAGPFLVAVAATPRPPAVQLTLCDPPRDARRASSLAPPRDPALLDLLLRGAEELAERHGWHPITRRQIRYGLKLLASCHDPGEPIKTSTVNALSALQVPPRRTLEVLCCVADELVVDDRTDSLSMLIDDQFACLPSQMR